MNEPQKILLTPEEEAKLTISLAFENACKNLTEKGIPTTPENLLPEFRANVEGLLTKNITLMVNLSVTTQQHEKELFTWLCKVDELIKELFTYRKKLDTKSIAFLIETQKKFETKVKNILTPSIN